MIRRRLALAVLCLFVAASGLATAEELLHSSVRAARAGAPEADSCPDPGTDGQPCGPDCPCLCCPGHASGLAVFGPRPFLGAPPSTGSGAERHDDLRPKGVLSRIFRPPRS